MPFPTGVQMPGPKNTFDRYGLLTVAEPVVPDNEHWIDDGILWNEDLCSSIHSTVEDCPIPVSGFAPMIQDRDFQSCQASPFRIYASYDCPPVGNTAQEAFSIAQKRLEIRENREVERVFWRGIAQDGKTVNPSLAFGNNTCGTLPVNLTPSGGPIGVVGSFAILESALGSCAPGSGVIHANYGLASFLIGSRLVFSGTENSWFTVTGQRLAIGAGYPGTGPGNIAAVPGSTWVFATGPMVIWRSEVFLTPERYREAVDRSLNKVTVYAERVYALGWSCCLFAIQVSLCA